MDDLYGQVLLPYGWHLSLAIGSVVTVRSSAARRQPCGSVGSATKLSSSVVRVLVMTRPDLEWTMVCRGRHRVRYELALGNRRSARGVRCHGCKRPLTDSNELRIRSVAIFRAPGSGPYPGRTTFCLDPQCIAMANHRVVTQPTTTGTSVATGATSAHNRVLYADFDGRVLVPEELSSRPLPVIDGLQWV